MKRNVSIILSGLIVFMISCSGNESKDTIAFKYREPFHSFPVSEKCDSGVILDFGTIGVREIAIVDTVAIVYTALNEKAFKIISLASDSIIGEMGDVGNGPKEMTYIPTLSQASFLRQGRRTILSIPDVVTSHRHNFDLAKVITGQEDSDSVVMATDIDNLTIFQGLYADGIEYKISVKPDYGRIERIISINGQPLHLEALDWLNHFAVDKPEKLGLLMPSVVVSPVRKRVVEMYNSYPQLNIYSLSGNLAKTITPDGKTSSYQKYMDNSADVPPMIYQDIRGYDNFFIVNKVCKDNTSELMIFDWDGNPLMTVAIPNVISSFDIDFAENILLTADFKEDIIRVYEFDKILHQLLG